MKTHKFANREAEHSGQAQAIAEAAEFHSKRMASELKSEAAKKCSNTPVGNYEYEQMIAEDADHDVRKLVSEAAFFIAEQRGFAPGHETSDWLQAEKEIEKSLRGVVIDRRQEHTEDRRSRIHPSAKPA